MTEKTPAWLNKIGAIWRRKPDADEPVLVPGASQATADAPSERLVLQRLRNRAMEALELLAAGEAGIRSQGASEYFNQFFDVIDDDSPWDWRDWPILTPEEVSALASVHDELLWACGATPLTISDEELIATEWPSRIQHLAAEALQRMEARGRFSEETEEAEPSGHRRQPGI